MPLIVVKRDGRREQFDPQKIINGLFTACEKRPISIADIERLVAQVEQEVGAPLEKEIASEQIGALVMKKLRHLDEVAYVRFASVYRQFKDISEFMDELKLLVAAHSGAGKDNHGS